MVHFARVLKKNKERDKNIKITNLIRLFVYSLLFFTIIFTVRITGFVKFLEPDGIQIYLQKADPYGPLLFVSAYVLTACLSLPTLPITALSGIIYGRFLGTVLSLIGANAGAMISFFIARYFARENVKRLTEGKFPFIEENLEKRGWLFLACVRTVPILPFALINYSFGLLPLSFGKYAIVSFFFMIPSTFIYVSFGISLKEYLLFLI